MEKKKKTIGKISTVLLVIGIVLVVYGFISFFANLASAVTGSDYYSMDDFMFKTTLLSFSSAGCFGLGGFLIVVSVIGLVYSKTNISSKTKSFSENNHRVYEHNFSFTKESASTKTYAEATQGVSCSKCGTMNPSGSNFCAKCGSNLSTKKICPYCNAENEKDISYCRSCGAKFLD